MTEILQTDDAALEPAANDIRVFGKWSGAEIQISDMSLEVSAALAVDLTQPSSFPSGLHPWRETTEISSTLGWSLSS